MSEQVADLQAFTAALSAAVTMKDVARTLFEQGLQRFGASGVGIVWMMNPGRLELVFAHGLTEAEFRRLDDAAAAGQRLPIRDAILTRKPVWLDSPEEIRARYPVLEPLRAERGDHGCAVVPLVIGDWSPGIIGFTFKGARQLAAEERTFIEVMAQLAAQAFERARLYDAEQEARQTAEHAKRVQQRLMAVVGHDLQTPLGSIVMATSMLLKEGGGTPEQRSMLQRIARSANRMAALLRDLVDFGRTQQGLGIAIAPTQVDVGELVRDALVEFETPGSALPVSLAVRGPVILRADPSRLAQIVSNLVGNALRHGKDAPVKVEVRGDAKGVQLSVHNDGPVIEPALLPHLFEPFRKGDSADGRGEGLGLYIVEQIARAHGGRVETRSDASAGTTFTVSLPRERGAAA